MSNRTDNESVFVREMRYCPKCGEMVTVMRRIYDERTGEVREEAVSHECKGRADDA